MKLLYEQTKTDTTYKPEQQTAAQRKINGIAAHKILSIDGNRLIFQLSRNDSKIGYIETQTPELYAIGQFIDLSVIRPSRTSTTIKFFGKTPPKFVPQDSRNIS